MGSLYEFKSQLDKQGMFWKNLQAKCLRGLVSVRWSTREQQWYPLFCKLHTFQNLLCQAVLNNKESTFADMKRKQGEEQPAKYIFVVDTVVKHHEFTLEETKFLKQVNFDGFINRVTWKVIHETLVREAIANLEVSTMMTTVQGKTIPLLATNWKTQLRDIFEFSNRKVASAKKWELTELFPSLKAAAQGQETVKVTDCTYPGAQKPLRILSSLFCLNTTGHDHISIPFAELILAALNGNTIDWVAELHQELHDEIVKLHQKHSQTHVKVERTAIGPHLTLILKAAGVMNVRHEAEAGFHTLNSTSTFKPHKKRCSEATAHPPTPQSTVKVVRTNVIDLDPAPAQSTPPPQSSEVPQSVVLDTEERWQVPDAIPNLTQQISQAHRRLENLLTTLASKAPSKFMRQIDFQFHKLQREALLHEGTQLETPQTAMTGSLVSQIGRLEEKLANKEELIDLYIENSFETQTLLAEKEEEIEKLKKELEINTTRDRKGLTQLGDLEQTRFLLKAKEWEATNLESQVQELTTEVASQKQKANEMHQIQQQEKDELTRLRRENEELRATRVEKEPTYNPRSDPESSQDSKRPIDWTERQALATGAAQQLLNDLQQELQVTKQEKEELQHQLQKATPPTHTGLPLYATHSRSEVYNRLLEHTAPIQTVMQYYQAYGAIDLLASHLPLPKRGVNLSLLQFQQLWEHANSRAKDTLAFMWTVSDIKLSLGTIEVVTASPPFYIRRYILRSIAWLAQHQATQDKEHNNNQILPILRPYNHTQKMEITKLQYKHETIFHQALDILRNEDTTICFEAVRRHQWLLEHHSEKQTNVTLPQLKEYVTQTLEEQQMTTSKGRFGTIHHGTILRMRTAEPPNLKPRNL